MLAKLLHARHYFYLISYISTCLLPLYFSISQPLYLSAASLLYLSTFLSLDHSICLSVYISTLLSLSLSLSISLSLYLYISLSLSISLSMYKYLQILNKRSIPDSFVLKDHLIRIIFTACSFFLSSLFIFKGLVYYVQRAKAHPPN